jgi:hypothetical protein
VAITTITAKTKQPQFIGATVTDTAIKQQVVAKGTAKDQATGADIAFGVFTTLCANEARDQEILLALVLNTNRRTFRPNTS